MTTKVRISLEQKDFEQLIKGKEIVILRGGTSVHIILQDIGWDNMIELIEKAKNNKL